MLEKNNHDSILVLDFGAQYSQLIARRVRECGVYSEIVPYTITSDEVKARNPKGIIFSGGPSSVKTPGSPRPDTALFDLGIPILGICYGLQVMSLMLGGKVDCPDKKEYGIANIDIIRQSVLFDGVSRKSQVWMSHGDSVVALVPGFECIASTPNCPYTAVENSAKGFYGVQFHPEVVHSLEGTKMIENFVLKVAKCTRSWNMGSIPPSPPF